MTVPAAAPTAPTIRPGTPSARRRRRRPLPGPAGTPEADTADPHSPTGGPAGRTVTAPYQARGKLSRTPRRIPPASSAWTAARTSARCCPPASYPGKSQNPPAWQNPSVHAPGAPGPAPTAARFGGGLVAGRRRGLVQTLDPNKPPMVVQPPERTMANACENQDHADQGPATGPGFPLKNLLLPRSPGAPKAPATVTFRTGPTATRTPGRCGRMAYRSRGHPSAATARYGGASRRRTYQLWCEEFSARWWFFPGRPLEPPRETETPSRVNPPMRVQPPVQVP